MTLYEKLTNKQDDLRKTLVDAYGSARGRGCDYIVWIDPSDGVTWSTDRDSHYSRDTGYIELCRVYGIPWVEFWEAADLTIDAMVNDLEKAGIDKSKMPNIKDYEYCENDYYHDVRELYRDTFDYMMQEAELAHYAEEDLPQQFLDTTWDEDGLFGDYTVSDDVEVAMQRAKEYDEND